jgi:hypothetical protein
MTEMIKNVISVCELKDIKVWSISNNYILKNIEASNYTLIVPDSQIDEFRKVTNSKFRIIGELSITGNVKEILQQKISNHKTERFGWYFQQFIKLCALEMESGDDVILIWDADTVPLKNLNFFDSDGCLIHYSGNENHSPYFKNINNLLKMKKENKYSFIAQCIAVRANWAKDFFQHITENNNNKDWKTAIIDSIDFSQESGFSEYEVLGTFITHKFSEDTARTTNRWIRHGNRLIGGIQNLEAESSVGKLSPYDFASFELWDENSSFIRRVWNKIRGMKSFTSAR